MESKEIGQKDNGKGRKKNRRKLKNYCNSFDLIQRFFHVNSLQSLHWSHRIDYSIECKKENVHLVLAWVNRNRKAICVCWIAVHNQ